MPREELWGDLTSGREQGVRVWCSERALEKVVGPRQGDGWVRSGKKCGGNAAKWTAAAWGAAWCIAEEQRIYVDVRCLMSWERSGRPTLGRMWEIHNLRHSWAARLCHIAEGSSEFGNSPSNRSRDSERVRGDPTLPGVQHCSFCWSSL